jgi:hypothetical protein
MSAKTTLVLLALLLLVAGVVYFIQFRQPGGGTATPAASGNKPLLDLTMPAINGFTVQNVISNTEIAATLDVSGTWWLSQPAGQPGDPATLSGLASSLAYISVQRVLTPTGSVSEYGLDKPTLKVEVATAAGPQSFTVGDETPSQGAYYAQKAGDTHVYLISTSVVDQLRQVTINPPVALPPAPTFAPAIVGTPTTP